MIGVCRKAFVLGFELWARVGLRTRVRVNVGTEGTESNYSESTVFKRVIEFLLLF